MKKTLFSFLLGLLLLVLLPAAAMAAGAGIAVDSSNFPDANFRSYVTENCDTDQDGFLSEAEIAAVASITVGIYGGTYPYPSDLTGIEFFSALEELNCGYCHLTNLDVSANKALRYLDCIANQLTILDVSANTELVSLYCSYNQLTSLDVSGNPKLSELFCRQNKLTHLDVSANPKLNWIRCDGNQLSCLDLIINTADELYEYGYRSFASTQTVAIELEKQDGIFRFDFASLVGAENIGHVTVTAVNPAYAAYTVRDGVLTSDTELTSIFYTYSPGNTADDLSMDVILLNIDCVPKPEDTLAIDKRNFPDDNFRSYIAARHDTNHDRFLSPEEIMSVMYMDVATGVDYVFVITPGWDIEDLTGIQYFPALTYLNCGDNQLTNLDVSANTALASLDCEFNQLTSLNVSTNAELVRLFCSSNALASLDLSGCPNLSYLRCLDNQLTSLDVTANTALTFLNCGYNALTGLDLSSNTMLTSTDNYDYYDNCSVSGQLAAAAMTEADGVYQLDFADVVGSENVDRVTVTSVTPADAQYSVQDGILTTETALTELTYIYDHGGPDIGTMDVTLNFN